MTEHTSTPWIVSDYESIHQVGDLADAHSGESIADCYAILGRTTGTAPGNAEFIVRACNSHEALLAVARMCLPWTGTDYTAKYEALAEEFRRETHMMAPGKSEPLESYSGENHDQERRKAWDEWTAARMTKQREQILAAIAAATGGDDDV